MTEPMNNIRIPTHEAYDRYLRRGTPTDALTTDNVLTAGYQLLEDFDHKLVNAMNAISVLRPLCTEITTRSDD